MIAKLIFAAVSIGLVGCKSTETAEFHPLPWQDNCYKTFAEDVSFLASDSAIDCGFLPMIADYKQRQATLACAKNAEKSGKPFRFGYASFGDDSAYCDVAIRTPDGRNYSLFFDFDVTGQMGSDGNHSALWISKCNGVEFKSGTIGMGSFFNHKKCVESKDVITAVVNARKN
jgi:hypothetical protein